jgi:glycerophosphoryl diester phosphodiesterase
MRAMSNRWWIMITLAYGLSAPAVAADACSARSVLLGWASLPADTFRPGPPSGAFDDAGVRRPAPRFASQPVQGVSSIKPAAAGWWALSDNGFATRTNSSDYLLALYRFEAVPRRRTGGTPRIELREALELRDPARHFPYRITRELEADRRFTGADLDPESLVVMADGSFWIGDEFGPWLLHFSAAGELLAPPYEWPDNLRSPQHPQVIAAKAQATVPASRGIEGLALAADGVTLVAALESPLANDAAEGRFVRLYRFDTARGEFRGTAQRYPLSDAATSIGEISHVAGERFLALERDDGVGAAARWKRVTAFDLRDGPVDPHCVVDLLDVADPNNLSGFGPRYTMPYFTIEAVHAIDARTLLVVNDNNYPAKGARGADVAEFTEWAWIRLPASLMPRAKR